MAKVATGWGILGPRPTSTRNASAALPRIFRAASAENRNDSYDFQTIYASIPKRPQSLDFTAQSLDFIAQSLDFKAPGPHFIAQSLDSKAPGPDFIAQSLDFTAQSLDSIAQSLDSRAPGSDFIAQILDFRRFCSTFYQNRANLL